jgi:hypothetical protein
LSFRDERAERVFRKTPAIDNCDNRVVRCRDHLLIGEFGIRDSSSYGGKAATWFTTLLSAVCATVSWTFWCLNPNSGDTGGLLDNDWVTPVQWKLNLLKPYMANMLGAATAAKKPYVLSRDYHGGLTISGNRIVFNGTTGAAHDLSIFSSNGKTVAHVRNIGTSIFVSSLHFAPGVYTAVLTSGQAVLAARTFSIIR